MPFLHFQAGRQKSPKQYDSFATKKNQGGAGIDFVFGIKNGKSEIQSIHFDTSKFTPTQAKAWLKKHGFKSKVEPAKHEAFLMPKTRTLSEQQYYPYEKMLSLLNDELAEKFPSTNGYGGSCYTIMNSWDDKILVKSAWGEDDDPPNYFLIPYTFSPTGANDTDGTADTGEDDDTAGMPSVELGDPVEVQIKAIPKDGSEPLLLDESASLFIPLSEAGKRNAATDALHANSIVRHALSMMDGADMEESTVAHMHNMIRNVPIGAESKQFTEAVWSTAFQNNLPDSSFAVISSGGTKDKSGKTVPRSLRHLPYKDANGKIDLPHLRNALARLPQSSLSAAEKATAARKLNAAAKSAGVGDANQGESHVTESWDGLAGTTFTETVSQPLAGARFDKQNLVVYGTKILGEHSLNNRDYPEATQKKAVSIFEGAKAYLNHPYPEDMAKPRKVQDLIGEHRNVRYADGSTYSDLHLLDKPLVHEQVVPIVENKPHLAGNSVVIRGRQRKGDDGRMIIEEIVAARSIDLVAEPGTTKGIYESHSQETNQMEWKDITLESFKQHCPDLVKQLLVVTKEQEDEKTKVLATEAENKKLKEDLAARDAKIADLEIKEAKRQEDEAKEVRMKMVVKLLTESKIPDRVKFEDKDGKKALKAHYLNLVERCSTEDEMKALVADWEKTFAAAKPLSETKDFSMDTIPANSDAVGNLFHAFAH